MSALPSSRKTHSEKHKQIFRQLLKELPNKSCVDCKTAQHPRWASWNLGCFICIRCSGIHRSMGTHISRVKSVDLDVWTDEQVESMIKWGNEKCNLFWEAKLPENYVPDGSKIENFIRTKYDMKKWAASSKIPDPMSISPGATINGSPASSSGHVNVPTPNPAVASAVGAARPQKATSASAPSLLDDDFGAFASSPSDFSSASPTPRPTRSTASVPVPARTAPVQKQATPAPATPVAAPAPKAKDVRTDLKKSILSLYSSPSSSTSSVPQQQQPSQYRATHTQNSHASSSSISSSSQQGSVSGISDSLFGLSFGNEGSQKTASAAFVSSPPPSVRTQTPAVMTPSPKPVPAQAASPQWANEWNDSSSSVNVNQWASASPAASVSAYNGTASGSSVFGAGFAGTFGNNNNNNNNSSNNSSSSTGAFNSTGLKGTVAPGLDDDLFKNVWS